MMRQQSKSSEEALKNLSLIPFLHLTFHDHYQAGICQADICFVGIDHTGQLILLCSCLAESNLLEFKSQPKSVCKGEGCLRNLQQKWYAGRCIWFSKKENVLLLPSFLPVSWKLWLSCLLKWLWWLLSFYYVLELTQTLDCKWREPGHECEILLVLPFI